uniref:Guanylate kinase n=1 Tax=Nilaparvata lugens endogenous nudivirus TaxID=1487700 RepID=X5GE81_9VIRU|nr:guanylate kinase [Nilaparvata lugens endogenous nudivirus]
MDSLSVRINNLNLPSKRAFISERKLSTDDDDNNDSTCTTTSQHVQHSSVFVGAASATGKTTILNYIRKHYRYCQVSNISFETLWNMWHNEDTVLTRLTTERNDTKIYEHTKECPHIYKIIHNYCKKFKKPHNSEKLITRFYTRVCHTLDRVIDPTDNSIKIIIIDTTKHYHDRFYSRLVAKNNGIDNSNIIYLYLQLIAYIAFLDKADHCQSLRVVVVRYNDGTVFGKDDIYKIQDLLTSVIHTERVQGNIVEYSWESWIANLDMPQSFVMCVNHLDIPSISQLIVNSHIDNTSGVPVDE